MLKFIKYVIGGLVLLLSSYLILALLFSALPAGSETRDCLPRDTVYVFTNGQHLFLAMRMEDLDSSLSAGLDLHDKGFVLFGWGDRQFYRTTPTWNQLTVSVAMQALLWPTDAAMHVVFRPHPQADWKKLGLCSHQTQKLRKFIANSFEYSAEGLLPLQASGYGSHDYFYQARGYYSCFYTSNTWVNEALKTAGLPACVWTPFDFGVLWQVSTGAQEHRSAEAGS